MSGASAARRESNTVDAAAILVTTWLIRNAVDFIMS
jgi:hypothetical protein